jgi:hypothetical protein
MVHSNHSRLLNTVCKHAVFHVVFKWQFSKPQKISKIPLNNCTSFVQRIEYCSQVRRFIDNGSIVKCIMFSFKNSRQVHVITLNQAMTNLRSGLIIHIALVILSLCTVSSEQMTVLLNKSYTNICSHFQIQNKLISCLCFFDNNTSNFSS